MLMVRTRVLTCSVHILSLTFFSCYSNVGRRGGRQDVSIGYGCLRKGTPIHEMMHVLGFFHEMARPDRDDNVDIHWENIKESKQLVIYNTGCMCKTSIPTLHGFSPLNI